MCTHECIFLLSLVCFGILWCTVGTVCTLEEWLYPWQKHPANQMPTLLFFFVHVHGWVLKVALNVFLWSIFVIAVYFVQKACTIIWTFLVNAWSPQQRHILRWLPGVWLSHSVPPVQDCEGWWFSSCCSSVAKHWWIKQGVLGLIPSDCQPFHFFPLSKSLWAKIF